MSTSTITKTFRRILKFMSKNKAPIMIASGLCLSAGAIVETARVAPEAKRRIEVKKQLLKVDKLSTMETIKTAGPVFLPVALMYGTSAACIIGGTASSMRQNTALAAACAMSENALQEYKQTVVETVGEKKEQLIEENLAKKKVESLSPAKSDLIVAGSGLIRCVDTYTGQEFIGDISKIKQAISELNYSLTTCDSYITLNEYQEALGMKQTSAGEALGWNINHGVLEVTFTSVLSTDNIPCLAVTVHPEPVQNYMEY